MDRDDDSPQSTTVFAACPGANNDGKKNSGPQRRRITRACDQCNQMRTKCDGEVPCAHCVGKQPCSPVSSSGRGKITVSQKSIFLVNMRARRRRGARYQRSHWSQNLSTWRGLTLTDHFHVRHLQHLPICPPTTTFHTAPCLSQRQAALVSRLWNQT